MQVYLDEKGEIVSRFGFAFFFSVLRQACMTFTGFYSMDDSYVYYRLGLLPIIIRQGSKRPGQVVVFFANGQGSGGSSRPQTQSLTKTSKDWPWA